MPRKYTKQKKIEVKINESAEEASAQEFQDRKKKEIANLTKLLAPVKEFPGGYPEGLRNERAKVREKIEKKKLQIEQSKYGKKKLELYIKLFLQHDGDGTKAAMEAFGIKSKHEATMIAYAYNKKFRLIGNLYMAQKGYTYGKLIDTALDKLAESKTPDWWDRVMSIAGYETGAEKKKEGTGSVVNIIQTEKDVLSKYVSGKQEEIVDLTPEEQETEKD